MRLPKKIKEAHWLSFHVAKNAEGRIKLNIIKILILNIIFKFNQFSAPVNQSGYIFFFFKVLVVNKKSVLHPVYRISGRVCSAAPWAQGGQLTTRSTNTFWAK